MKHQTLTCEAKAAVVTDKGEVRLLVSTYDLDRGGDVVKPGAFADTIRQWQESGKNIPVHYDHGSNADDIIGAADPHSMREVEGQGLVVEAKLDLAESKKAAEVWRLVKSGVISCSFGYLAEDVKQADGTRLLTKVDLFEVTLTPSPMNPRATVLDYKGSRPAHREPLLDCLDRDPAEVVREAHIRKGIEDAEAKALRAESVELVTYGTGA